MLEEQEGFEAWLSVMDATIRQFREELPKTVSKRLDFTPESLDVLERWLLSKYDSTDAILESSEKWFLDGAARYVGETILRATGGEWEVELEDPKYAFYEIPEIRTTGGLVACPVTLVTASLDRRQGNYIRKVVENLVSEEP